MGTLMKEDVPPPKSYRDTQNEPVKLSLHGSGSYPTMIRARTANRNKIQKRNSESSMITGRMGPAALASFERNRSNSKKRRMLKKSVYSRATRRKSLENLGLVVRNPCTGTAKLHWPSEKKETDVFDLLPEGCLQVRSLCIKSPKNEEGRRDDDVDDDGVGEDDDDFGNFGLRGGNENEEDNEPDATPNRNASSPHQGHPRNHHRLKKLSNSNCSINNSVSEGNQAGNKTDWKNRRSISVIVRIRPKQQREMKEKSIVFKTDAKTVLFDPKEKTKDFYFQGVKQSTRNDFGRKRPNRNVTFQYDKVYGPEATNRQIFGEMLQDLTDHLIEGYNSTVFAYGATGSGKTYTMIGSGSNPGLTVLMVESLYRKLEELAPIFECDVVCSYLEVYNETIKDLLRPEKELSIREDGKKGIIIPELTFYKPRGPSELLKLLRNGNRARTQHATDLNAESSRSHAVFEVKLCLKKKKKREDMNDGGDNINDDNDIDVEADGFNKVEVITSKLVMVDLAGSERGTAALASSLSSGAGGNQSGIFVSGGVGARQREGASINKSLLALANCISALADGKCHIPYRNSKLTRLLKDALSGNCTTVMIANISPSALTSEDTYNTLKYADRAKSIVGPGMKQKNVFLEDLIIEDCVKSQVAELQAKLDQLAEMLEEEKLKNELMMKEQTRLKEENMTMAKNSREGFFEDDGKEKKITRKNNKLGGGDADNTLPPSSPPPPPPRVKMEEEISRQSQGHDEIEREGKRSWNSNEMGGSGNTEEENHGAKTTDEKRLPKTIQKYLVIAGERARVFTDYVEFAAQNRLAEWLLSCKKLKCDMGDFLGRLPVSDKNYVTFCKLKNEVNNVIQTNPEQGGIPLFSSPENYLENHQTHHRKYAIKLKNLTEKLELVRREVILKSGANSSTKLKITRESSGGDGTGDFGKKKVEISLEDFLLFNRLLSEQEGNDKMELFYQQFCQQINSQLITSGRTLINALKLIKSMYTRLQQTQSLNLKLEHEYSELAELIYGAGPPPLSPQTVKPCDNYVPENFLHPNQPQTINKISNQNSRSISNTSLISNPSPAPPPPLPMRLPAGPGLPVMHSKPPQGTRLGRHSSSILEDLSNMRKLVETPLLIELTSLLGEEEDGGEDDENEYTSPDADFVDSPEHDGILEKETHEMERDCASGTGRTSRRSKPETASVQYLFTPKSCRSSASEKTYRNKSRECSYNSGNNEDEEYDNNEDEANDEDDEYEYEEEENKMSKKYSNFHASHSSDENEIGTSESGTESASD